MADLDDHPSHLTDWESAWAPYDEPTYRAALDLIQPDDVVLDIGAGDLRFARRAAQRARRVIAIERRAELLGGAYPRQLSVICGDARTEPFPAGITVGVLLMRHCRHFAMYVKKLRAAGCRRLLTNARWGMDVERVEFDDGASYRHAAPGWYACQCGAVGFKPCAPESLTDAMLAGATQLSACPACDPLSQPGPVDGGTRYRFT
jgi:hypothetical protein